MIAVISFRVPKVFLFRIAWVVVMIGLWSPIMAHADAVDTRFRLQDALDTSSMGIHGEVLSPEVQHELDEAVVETYGLLKNKAALSLWKNLPPGARQSRDEALRIGKIKGAAQHVAALEMIGDLEQGDVEGAKDWRAVIALPKYANAVEGSLALQNLGGNNLHRDQVAHLLGREYLVWQISRVRELGDDLRRMISRGRATPELVIARASEIRELAAFPEPLLTLAADSKGKLNTISQESEKNYQELLQRAEAGEVSPESLSEVAATWRLGLESELPILLSAEDIKSRERIVMKLLRLVPKEYGAGVRNGEITVSLEYQEAKSFTAQAWLMINELLPVWKKQKVAGYEERAGHLLSAMETLEGGIEGKKDPDLIAEEVKKISAILTDDFGLSLTKAAGSGKNVVTETALEIRSLLGESLVEARAGRWKKAEELRLDAYINFDLEIEPRVIPRNPQLGLRAERSFLEGDVGAPGIKAVLDAHSSEAVLSESYGRTLAALEESVSLVKVGLSPAAAAISAGIIVLREGLEAVVILAALLAGMRGAENRSLRRQVGLGAWCAVGASALLFIASQSLLHGLSHYGEKLEAFISILAVLILLMVTNWVFHKYYWTGWNSRLREMSKSAQSSTLEGVAMIGVGFMTIFREGFETTLFMQSLILEAGIRPVLLGLGVSGALITAMGVLIFKLGTKLPYRKMLVYTGVLVVFILYTFLGSTVRLFQTVGWLPIHPVAGLQLPSWTGLWLGIYPTWEGILIPLLAFVYVGGAWLWVKFSNSRETSSTLALAREEKSQKSEMSDFSKRL